MGYIISALVVIFFIGSASFLIPSRRTKHIAQLRLDAVKLGFKISSLAYSNVSFKSDDIKLASYQIKNSSNITVNNVDISKINELIDAPPSLNILMNMKRYY